MPQSIYEQTIKRLMSAHISSPRSEARLLIAAAVQTDADSISAATKLNPEQIRQLEKMVNERLSRKPLDKILGHREFYKYDFMVDEDVLSPRPDTETLVEAAAGIVKDGNIRSVIDLGTGSGCILLSLLKDFPALKGLAVDKSGSALAIAEKNAGKLGIGSRCTFLQADWFCPGFIEKTGTGFDLLVSNPPYIPSADIAGLDPEVREHDPAAALDGGPDGLDSYRAIAGLAGNLLAANGCAVIEAGIGQAGSIIEIFSGRGLEHCRTIADLPGIARCIIFRKKDCN